MPLQVLNGPTIAAQQALSDGIDVSAGPVVRITMPPVWTGANITFQLSSDGIFYNDLFDVHGKEVTIVAVPGAAVRIPLEWSPIISFMKLRSGTREYPVPQEAERVFAIAIEVPAAPAG